MNGRDYRATVRLSNATDETLAAVGETCERVAPASLEWLLAQRLIEPIERLKTSGAQQEDEHGEVRQ